MRVLSTYSIMLCVLWTPIILFPVSTVQSAEPMKVDVFLDGDGGVSSYRIPSLITTTQGTLLAFAEARHESRSDTGDIDVVMRRSTDDGMTWSETQTIWNEGRNTCGNPCAVVDKSNGRIWLLLTWNSRDFPESKTQPGFGENSRRVFVCHSEDDGVSWSDPQEITSDVKREPWTWYATGPGSGIQIQNGPYQGRLVIPCDHKIPGIGNAGFYSHVIYSDDHGKSWNHGAPTPKGYANECEVVELDGGRLLLNMRNYDRKMAARQIAVSDDGGATWKDQQQDPALVEPTCQASIHRYSWPSDDAAGVILFSNPAHPKSRERLTIRASLDDAKTWPHARVLEPKSSAYSSLSIVTMPDGSREIGCLYERDGYKHITFARFPLTWVTGPAE